MDGSMKKLQQGLIEIEIEAENVLLARHQVKADCKFSVSRNRFRVTLLSSPLDSFCLLKANNNNNKGRIPILKKK